MHELNPNGVRNWLESEQGLCRTQRRLEKTQKRTQEIKSLGAFHLRVRLTLQPFGLTRPAGTRTVNGTLPLKTTRDLAVIFGIEQHG